jgi:four helix bundle protein
MAQASLAELETQMEIAARLKYITTEQMKETLISITALGRQLYALRNALQKKLS